MSSEIELRVSQRRLWVGGTQLVEPALRLFTEPVEIGIVGKSAARLGHWTPSFLRKGESPFLPPSVRNEGEEEG